MQLLNTGFHGSSIIGFASSTGTLILDLEDVLIEGEKRCVSLRMEGLRDLTRDGQPVDFMRMEAEDGEVLTLGISPNRLDLICEWNDFENHARHTHSYVCIADAVTLDAH